MNPERENRTRYALYRDIPLLLTTAAAAVVIFVIVSRMAGDTADMQGYIELLAVIPCTIMLLGLIYSVEGDPYVTAGNKRIMYVIEVLVLGLILQNYVEYTLSHGNYSRK